tara:strand:+ start:43 stop:1458 length:1416 start_codon:yes stop_codon:yes gene_type:complete
MADNIHRSEVKSIPITGDGTGGKGTTVHFANKYTYDDNGGVKSIEIIKYNNANKDGAIVIGTMEKGVFELNEVGKTQKVGDTNVNWEKLKGNNKTYLANESKKISKEENTLDILGVNKTKEKLNKFKKDNGIPISEEEVTESVNAKTSKLNQVALKNKQFRKQYGNYFYPLGIKNNNQDRIKITVVDFKPQGVPLEKGERRDPINFELKRAPGEKVIRGSATLPIPNGVSDQNRVDFSDATLNPAQVAGAQIALNTLLGGIGEGGQALGETITGVVKNPNTPTTIASLLTSFALNINPNQLLSRTQGGVFNNNLALLFKGPTLRPFNFDFNVSPRDSRESIEVQKIIRMFKQSSAVQRTENGLFLGSPHVYDIEFLSGSSSHNFLPKIKTCALQVFAVNYMPNNTYMTYENSSMVSYSFQFQFKELDPIFNDDYDELDDFKSFNELTAGDSGSISFDDNGGKVADSGGIGF